MIHLLPRNTREQGLPAAEVVFRSLHGAGGDEGESGTLVANSLRQLKGGGCNMQGGEATGAVDDGNNSKGALVVICPRQALVKQAGVGWLQICVPVERAVLVPRRMPWIS